MRVHRWAGLFIAFFLLVAGVTGSVIAFYEPLDTWLNPGRHAVAPGAGATRLNPVTLHERALLHARPYAAKVRLDSIDLENRPDRPVGFLADPRVDPASGRAYEDYPREFVLDPYSGALLHVRRAEAPLWPIGRDNVLDVVYRLHYSLALPGSIGTWLFGIAAIVWTLDCVVGLYLTFPLRRAAAVPATAPARSPFGPPRPALRWFGRWVPAWQVRWRGSSFKLNFDLHRAGGLWAWLMLLILAWSSVALNLREQVYEPVMGTVFDMRRPGNDASKRPMPLERPALDWRQALARGRELAAERAVAGNYRVLGEISLNLDRDAGIYSYRFISTADIGDSNGAYLNFDADSGAFRSLLLGDRQPFGVWLTDWITTLHMAQVWGLPMKVFICGMGMAVAVLSVTGVVVWWRKRRARTSRARPVVTQVISARV